MHCAVGVLVLVVLAQMALVFVLVWAIVVQAYSTSSSIVTRMRLSIAILVCAYSIDDELLTFLDAGYYVAKRRATHLLPRFETQERMDCWSDVCLIWRVDWRWYLRTTFIIPLV